MNKSIVSFVLGIIIGYNGLRLLTHVVYLTIIAGLVIGLYLK